MNPLAILCRCRPISWKHWNNVIPLEAQKQFFFDAIPNNARSTDGLPPPLRVSKTINKKSNDESQDSSSTGGDVVVTVPTPSITTVGRYRLKKKTGSCGRISFVCTWESHICNNYDRDEW